MFNIFADRNGDYEPDFSELGTNVLKWLVAGAVGALAMIALTFTVLLW